MTKRTRHLSTCVHVNTQRANSSVADVTFELFSSTAMTIKKAVQPKCRLPVLNWVAMKPNQVKGTVFSELDDEKLYTVSTAADKTLEPMQHVNVWDESVQNPEVPKVLQGRLIVCSQVIDFYRFEETFRLGHPSISEDDIDGTPKSSRKSKRPETVSLLEPNRLRNVGAQLKSKTSLIAFTTYDFLSA